MSAAATAISALEAWAASAAPPNPALTALVSQAHAIAHREVMSAVPARAASHGIDATSVVWSDARCEARDDGKKAIGKYSMDLTALCKESAIYFAPHQHMHDLSIVPSVPLSSVHLPTGNTLEDFLVDTLKVRTTPRKAEVRVQGLVVYSSTATVKFHKRTYGTAMTSHTLVFTPDGQHGFCAGDGMVGVAGKAVQFSQAPPGRKDAAATPPPTLTAVTLFVPGATRAPVATYRSLGAAALSLSDEVVPDSDISVLSGASVAAVRVEKMECHVVGEHCATPEEVDDMCRHLLAAQSAIGMPAGPRADAARASLAALKDEAYCHQGHGPWKRGSTCPGCGARVVCC